MSEEFWLILGMAAVTFGVRYPVLALVGRLPLPAAVSRALTYVPVAVLTAIIVPAALMPQGVIDLDWRNPHFLAAAVAVLVAWRSQALLPTILLGMLSFVAVRMLLP